jgi:hypothetical protein
VSELRDKIAKEIVRWQIANGEEFLPNSLADRMVAILPRAPAPDALVEALKAAGAAAELAKMAAAKAIAIWTTNDVLGVQQLTLAEAVMAAIDSALSPQAPQEVRHE